MQESALLKLSVVSSIIGLVILFSISSLTEIEYSDINELTLNNLDDTIKVQGLITKVTPKEKITLLEIAQHNKMPIVIFDTNITINPGDEVEILGTVEEYNGKIELIADRIEQI